MLKLVLFPISSNSIRLRGAQRGGLWDNTFTEVVQHYFLSQSCSLSLVLNLPLLLLYSEHVLILIIFPVQNREQFVVLPEVVPWPKVADALGYYFLENLDYLGRKLLGVGGCG